MAAEQQLSQQEYERGEVLTEVLFANADLLEDVLPEDLSSFLPSGSSPN